MTFTYTDEDFPANNIARQNYVPEFNDEFESTEIDLKKWVPYYLPHWSSREKTKPNYHFENGALVLKITGDQQPWCPEFNGEIKCSSLQTGLFSGNLGSRVGQHRFNPLCVVREEQQTIKKYTPQYGYVEIRAKAIIGESNLVALWMIGFEDLPENSGEICIVEIKGNNICNKSAKIGFGIHPFADYRLKDEFFEEDFEIDVTKFNIYAVDWTPDKVDFYINNKKTKTINQSPHYPMQFMLNIYEIPAGNKKNEKDTKYPKKFIVDYIRAYKL